MLSRLLPLIFLIQVLSGCSKNDNTSPTQSWPAGEMTSSEYDVLSAVIDSFFIRSSATTVVVEDSTTPGIFGYNIDSTLTLTLEYVQEHIPVLKAETMADFKIKNFTTTYIRNPSSLHPGSILFSTAQREMQCDSTWDWNKFYETYPGAAGLFSVGRVGFNSDAQQALAYVGCMEMPLAGAGCYYVLSREQGKWQIVGSMLVWIS